VLVFSFLSDVCLNQMVRARLFGYIEPPRHVLPIGFIIIQAETSPLMLRGLVLLWLEPWPVSHRLGKGLILTKSEGHLRWD